MTDNTSPVTWEPPAKGDWRGLHDHFPRAVTPEYQRLLTIGITEGEEQYMEKYGLPVRTLRPAFVNGRVFVGPVPLVGPATNRLPPAPALWLAVRLVPAFRRRAKAARKTITERPWRSEADSWYRAERAQWEAANAALEAVDPTALDDMELCAHLDRTRANATDGYREHFRLHGPDLVPTGMFLARAGDWGIAPAEAAALLAGSSPASRGDRPLPRWCLVTGYDLDDLTAIELPRRAGNAGPGSAAVDPADDTELRARVPAADRPEWDQLLADARATYGVRDDNGILTAAWPVGLLRRAMLEAGRRLEARGALAAAEHAVELTVDEVAVLLRGE